MSRTPRNRRVTQASKPAVPPTSRSATHREAPVIGSETSHASDIEISAAPSNDWLIWQLVDSAFPTGGFAHSAGLEAAWQHGEVRTRVELVSYLESSLHQLGRAALPFVTAVHDSPRRFTEIDALAEAFLTNHVANRASRFQGRAFLLAVRRTLAEPKASSLEPAFGHLAPVFGVVTSCLGIARDRAVRLFFFGHLRGLLAAAVRLNIVGPMDAQAIQFRLAPSAQAIAIDCAALSLEDLAQTSPLLDVWQGTHDRLYSRLFQS